MSESAGRTDRSSESALKAVREVGAGTRTVASATEDLTPSILEIGRQVDESSRVAGDAVREAERS